MHKHLLTSLLRGREPQLLTDLGQINVIAGKNNSGKSTLLEALALNVDVGVTLRPEVLHAIWNGLSGNPV